MTDSELSELLVSLVDLFGEREWLEFKSDYEDYEKIGEYISALSNSACHEGQPYGYLIWGIEDGTNLIKGTKFRLSTTKKGNEELECWLATLLNPRIGFEVYEWSHDGKLITMLRINAAQTTPVMWRGEAYIRVGTYKKLLKAYPAKARKIWTGKPPVAFETGLAMDDLGALDVLRLINIQAFFELHGWQLPLNQLDAIRVLEAEGVVVENSAGNYGITNAGALLFAKRLSVFPRLRGKTVRLVFYEGKSRLKTIREVPGEKGYAIGFEGLVRYIVDSLPQNEVIERSIRKMITLYPEEAIRELVANALIHQDLAQTGTHPMIEVFKDRIEFTNNGAPLIDPLRFLDYTPRSRNERLASMMRKVGICEERGSGIDKVVHLAEVFQLPAPDFLATEMHMKAILYAPRLFKEMSKSERIRACYQHAALKYVSREQMTNTSLRERFKIEKKNYSMVSRIIADTIAMGLVREFDPTNKAPKHVKYVPFWAEEHISAM